MSKKTHKTQTTLGLITARGGSKGIPGKNIKPIAGKPLIAWTIEAALASKQLDRIVVSTDSIEISDIAKAFGAEVPFLRPDEISGDASPHIDTVLHAIDWLAENEKYHPDALCLLQPTSPLRTAEDIDAAIALSAGTRAKAVVSVSETMGHPYLSYTVNKDNRLEPVIKHKIAYTRRQNLPAIYTFNGALFVNRCDSLRKDRTFTPPDTRAYIMPQENSFDIDTPFQFRLVELLMMDRIKSKR